jgi:hypothetical protein
MLAEPVWADVRYGGKTLANALWVPPDLDAAVVVFPYSGGRLAADGFSLIEHVVAGADAGLDAILLVHAPELTAAERSILRRVSEEESEQVVGEALHGDCWECVADYVTGWGSCDGEVTPVEETCETEGDDDCDGVANDEGKGCGCAPGEKVACYEGPEGTQDVGLCAAGERACGDDGELGACEGQVLPAVEDCDGVVCSAPVWSKLFGDPGGGPTAGVRAALAVDPAGGVFAAFDFTGSIQVGQAVLTSAGGRDIAVAKLDPGGSVAWAISIGADKDELVGGMAVGADGNPVVFGGFYSGQLVLAGTELLNDESGADAFVAKLGGSSGAPVWARRIGVTGTFFTGGVAVAPPGDGALAGDVVIAGTYQGMLVCNGPSCVGGTVESTTLDGFVQRIAADGSAVRWTKTAGGPGNDAANAVAVAQDGAVVIAGKVVGAATFGAQSLATTGPSDANGFVAKLTKDGALLWARGFGDAADQSVASAAVGPDGAIAVVGITLGALDLGGDASVPALGAQMFVAKLAADGSGVWARGYPGENIARAVTIDAAGDVIATGRFQSMVDFGGKAPLVGQQIDAFVLKLDAAGAYRWARAFGGADKTDRGDAVTTLPGGQVIFAGAFAGKVDFGLGDQTCAGLLDAGVALFQP